MLGRRRTGPRAPVLTVPAVLAVVAVLSTTPTTGQQVPCRGLSDPIDIPCLCASNTDNGTDIVCDNVVFSGDFPLLPFRAEIHSFSQRNVGHQRLPAQIFTAANIPLRKLDFSRNVLNQLTGRLLDGLEDTLEEVYLGYNQLGDQLNPIFSTGEFRGLKRLKILDLRSNGIKAVDGGILDGCDELQVSLSLRVMLMVTLMMMVMVMVMIVVMAGQ